MGDGVCTLCTGMSVVGYHRGCCVHCQRHTSLCARRLLQEVSDTRFFTRPFPFSDPPGTSPLPCAGWVSRSACIVARSSATEGGFTSRAWNRDRSGGSKGWPGNCGTGRPRAITRNRGSTRTSCNEEGTRADQGVRHGALSQPPTMCASLVSFGTPLGSLFCWIITKPHATRGVRMRRRGYQHAAGRVQSSRRKGPSRWRQRA